MRANVTAKIFWELFCKEVRVTSEADGYGAVGWTSLMTTVLHGVQDSLGLWCQCRGHQGPNGRKGERMGIDFTWYSNGADEWVPPLVAIEHENQWHSQERLRDHWKVSQIASPLRVFIGYTKTESELERAADELKVHEDKWFSIKDGESIIILGYAHMQKDFRAWITRQGVQAWKGPFVSAK